jgi:CheY-like chemotaxis protein
VPAYKVLIIEDAVELAEVIQATLESMDITSHHETHGERGLEAYKQMQPDLLLLDIALPDIKGWKILERIKLYTQENTGARMPKVVIISAYGDPANRLMGKLQDVTRYLIKPFTPDEVETVVSGALGINNNKLVDLPVNDTDPVEEILSMGLQEASAETIAAEADEALYKQQAHSDSAETTTQVDEDKPSTSTDDGSSA